MNYVNFCLVLLSSLILSSGSIKTDQPSMGYYPGEFLPNIEITDEGGNNLDLSDFKGKKVVINFWATYDAQSRASNIQMHNYLKNNYPEIALLSVSFDENKSVYEQTLLWDQLENNSQYREKEGTQSEIYKEFNLRKGFKNYLIDEDGIITAMNVTPETLDDIL